MPPHDICSLLFPISRRPALWAEALAEAQFLGRTAFHHFANRTQKLLLFLSFFCWNISIYGQQGQTLLPRGPVCHGMAPEQSGGQRNTQNCLYLIHTLTPALGGWSSNLQQECLKGVRTQLTQSHGRWIAEFLQMNYKESSRTKNKFIQYFSTCSLVKAYDLIQDTKGPIVVVLASNSSLINSCCWRQSCLCFLERTRN